jgi:hypothetical protein
MSDNTETLKFRIGLSGTYFDKKPTYSVGINTTPMVNSTVEVLSDEIFYVEFESVLEENTENELFVRLENKSINDTITDDGVIVKDLLLNIHSIEIDEIDLSTLIWTNSVYQLDRPQKFNNQVVTELKNCVNLGWNGAYKLQFTSPFYIWLLENI